MELNSTQITAKGYPQPFARVYLFHGSDDALKREAVARLRAALIADDFADFDLDEREIPPTGAGVDGGYALSILASAGGAPMASERRLVIMSGVQRLGKEEQEALAAGLDRLGPLSCLALIAGATEYEAGKAKGKQLSVKLQNAIEKHGATVLCDAPGEGDLKARVGDLLKAQGKTMEPEALRVLIAHAAAVASERGGGGKTGDVTALMNELDKMIAYVGDRPRITLADAHAVGLRDAQENIFALCDAVGRRDLARAMAETDALLEAGDKPDAVAARTFVMLARHLRMVWGAGYLAAKKIGPQNARTLPPEVQSVLSGEMLGLTARQSFRLRDLQEQARGWNETMIRAALARVLASDLAMKGIGAGETLTGAVASSDDPASNLRLLVLELCRTA